MILFVMLAVMLAACTDDLPSDIRGCVAEDGETADETYDKDDGCAHGSIIHEEGHGEEGDHAEEGEDHSEDADGENHEEDTEASDGEDTDHEEESEGEDDHE